MHPKHVAKCATPDAVDYGWSICFGLGEVKCPHTKFHVTQLEACSDPNSFTEKISDTECRLKPNHPYYAQVQKQTGVSGAKWCDFIDYTRRVFTLRGLLLILSSSKTSELSF